MNLKYDGDQQILYVQKNDGSLEIVESDCPSEPVVSADQTKAVYIAPLAWECLGSLYLYDLLTGEKKECIQPDDKNYIPKKVIWLDNRNLAVIIGFGLGIVAIGGNVFIYDVETSQKKALTEYDLQTQVTGLVWKDNLLYLEGIHYSDDTFQAGERFKKQVKLMHQGGEVQSI